jgi:ATP-dependent RNA helicase SUPV3L1/SUV3
MKKAQKALRDFERLKSQLKKTENIVVHSKAHNLWDHEANVRKKIKALRELAHKDFAGFSGVEAGYLDLLGLISRRLLEYYNKKNRTDFQFDEIVAKDYSGYVQSGVISMLVTSHIPDLVASEFERVFPQNPKDEYPRARALHRSFVLHLGDTNTGKTYQAVERLKQAENGVYLAPLRILALENYEKLNREGIPCSLVTGEEEILVENARHICSTIEKLDVSRVWDVAVIDEIQMIENTQRGQAWTRALLGLQCAEIHVCGAKNARDLAAALISDCGDDFRVIEYTRQTPLAVDPQPFSLRRVEKGDALVAFSKKRVLELSKFYRDKGVKNSVIYGDLPPQVRRMQYRTFISGESPVLVSTDAIGMGVNLPIRRIVFMALEKFDGEDVRPLTPQEIKQIAGRAGRKGIYETGFAAHIGDGQAFLEESLQAEDEPIRHAILGPSEAIVQIAGLPLREKLALWSTRHDTLKSYRKMDVRDYLLILDSLKKYRLPQETEYKLMILPFDANEPELLDTFLSFVEEFFPAKRRELTRPRTSGGLLADWERYYQKLNLYYAFSKNFGANFEPEWVYEERGRVSEKINRLLLRL